MKNIFKFWFFLIMSFIFIDNVKAVTNPYSQTGSYGTNCTWYAWKMAYEKGKVTLPGWEMQSSGIMKLKMMDIK